MPRNKRENTYILQSDDKKNLAEVAVFPEAENRSGTYILKDYSNICSYSQFDGIELLPIAEALKKYHWLKEKYYWGLLSREDASFSEIDGFSEKPFGYFLKVRKGENVKLPAQAALYMSDSIGRQVLHNVVILEEDAKLTLITGCVSHHGLYNGEHIAVSETYIGKNAEFTQTMIHSWGPNIDVFPHSATAVEAGGVYVSNYVSLRPAGRIESNPVTYLNGAGSSAKYFSVILGSENSTVTLGGDVYLNGEKTSAEIAHRAVCTGGRIVQQGLLIGKAECKAHVDCSGMLITPGADGYIQSIPGLQSHHPDAHMSHEASIGKIAPQQVQYLMARGMEEREAISMIIRGFLDADISGLGSELDARISEMAELAGHGE